MKTKYLLILFFILLTSIFSCSSSKSSVKKKYKPKGIINNQNYSGKGGETKVITAEGISEIFESGEQTAFNSALKHAMKKAVAKVLGTIVQSQTIVKNSILVEDKIYAKSYGFVQKYEVLEEKNVNNVKRVTIKAWVVLGDVKKDALALGLIQDRVGRPVVLVSIKETNFNNELTEFSTQYLQEELIKKKFEFVNQTQLKEITQANNYNTSTINQNTDILSNIGLQTGAQILIKGKVVSNINDLSKNPLFKNSALKSVTTKVFC